MSQSVDLVGIGMTSRRTRMRLVQRLREKGIKNEEVLSVMGETPRHIFLDEALAHRAYEDTALPIGYNQTISQPYIVARMTEILLALGPRKKVLEVGTGSGYQAAVLSSLVRRVYTMEIVPELGQAAQERFAQQGLYNVTAKVGDGYYGWPEHAPFDAIIVTAAGDHIPPDLIRQLKKGGVMVIPVGPQFMVQQLILVEKDQQGEVTLRQLLPVRFVPLTGGSQ